MIINMVANGAHNRVESPLFAGRESFEPDRRQRPDGVGLAEFVAGYAGAGEHLENALRGAPVHARSERAIGFDDRSTASFDEADIDDHGRWGGCHGKQLLDACLGGGSLLCGK